MENEQSVSEQQAVKQPLQFIVNDTYTPLFTTDKRYVIIMGGRSAGRSFVASQFATVKLTAEKYFRCAIMRFILGDIRPSIYTEISDRIDDYGLENTVQKKDLSFHYGANSIIGLGFRRSSSDQKSKLKSLASFNTVIIEEADEINEADFMQLDDSLRTQKGQIKIVLLLNTPSKKHWIIDRWFNLEPLDDAPDYYRPVLKSDFSDKVEFIHTDYTVNEENIAENTLANFSDYKRTHLDYYYTAIKGYVSSGNKGRIFPNAKPMSKKVYNLLPYSEIYGIDFGYTNDPATVFGVKMHNNKLFTREIIYETGLLNKQLSDRMEAAGIDKSTAIIYADSAEPKSIAELRSYGWNVIPALKGADSIRVGISTLQEMEIYYTDDSANLENERDLYVWKLDKDKEPTNDPIDKYNHGWDAIRYAVHTFKNGTQFWFS